MCLSTNDAERLEVIDGLLIEEGPEYLCPGGKKYRCHGISIEEPQALIEYVDREVPVEVEVEKRVEVLVDNPKLVEKLKNESTAKVIMTLGASDIDKFHKEILSVIRK